KTAWYFPGFAEGHIWEIDGRVAVADRFDSSSVVPVFERYFLGGATSLRGYKYRHVSPTSTLEPLNDEPIGGNTLYFGSLEYSIPIIERLRIAFFYDIGNVSAKSYKFDFSEYFDNWGIGMRLNIPQIGPLRLDYGVPISQKGSGRFNFTVGYTKDF
ncbi:MAG TPA: BamA/TamA family outer membrane protein, partial [Candidatus Eisenbacteria bacterium]|nr:BamA/TamA family outer membrane protein [Candidatus Eisenbacteria bacterium]